MISRSEIMDALDYDPSDGHFRWRKDFGPNAKAGQIAGTVNPNGYISIYIGGATRGRRMVAHRIAWMCVHGVWPDGDIDHINRDRRDNRISNLRVATRSQNRANSASSSKNVSGFTGVMFDKRWKKWTAFIRSNKRYYFLGRHDEKECAIAVRSIADKSLNGHYSSTGYFDGKTIIVDVDDNRLNGCERIMLSAIGLRLYPERAQEAEKRFSKFSKRMPNGRNLQRNMSIYRDRMSGLCVEEVAIRNGVTVGRVYNICLQMEWVTSQECSLSNRARNVLSRCFSTIPEALSNDQIKLVKDSKGCGVTTFAEIKKYYEGSATKHEVGVKIYGPRGRALSAQE